MVGSMLWKMRNGHLVLGVLGVGRMGQVRSIGQCDRPRRVLLPLRPNPEDSSSPGVNFVLDG